MSPKPYSPASLAERWSCSAEKVRQMIKRGELQAFAYGRSFRIPYAEVARIEGQEDGSDLNDVHSPPSRAARPASVSHHPFGWPQMMKRKTAALYCDLSESAFTGEVLKGRLPSSVILGGRDHWHRPALDAALAHIAGGSTNNFEEDFWKQRAVPEYRRRLHARYNKPES